MINTNYSSLIMTRNLKKTYQNPAGEIQALKGINLVINQGEFVGIIGRSGAGKSTLINMLAGLDSITSGEVWVENVPIHAKNEDFLAKWRGIKIGLIFQNFNLISTLSLLDNVMLPLDFSGQFNAKRSRDLAKKLFDEVGISEHIFKLPSGISGGQQQRTAIVRALINNPAIILADEPTGRLDSVTSESIMHIFEAQVIKGKTIIMVTHDESLIPRFSKVYFMEDGLIFPKNTGDKN
ncbi:MAG: ABC transporter ATP-binding protein [Anaerolineaceae bacterium]